MGGGKSEMNQYPLHTLSTQNGLDDVNLLRTLIDALPEQVYVKDTEGCYVLNNLAHVRALGAASPEQIAGKSDVDFYPEELAERYRADELVVLDSGRPLIDKEEPSVDGEGDERWHSTTKVPLRNGDGEIVGLVGTTRDVTDQKEAQEALKESEERFRTAFEDSPIGVALVGLDGRRFRVNHALCEMLGHSEEELLSKEYLEHIHPDDREISSKHRHKTLEKGEGSYILERRYVHADGHTVWNLTSVSLIQDSQGNPSHLVCLHQDITERKEVETKLRKSEARLAEAQRIARLGSWEWDVKTGEVSWSDETCRIYGFESQGFVPTLDQLMEMVHPDDRELVRKNIDAALYEGESYDFEHRIVRTDGEERVVHRQAEVVFDDEDEPLRMIGTVHDITERKQAEKAIEQLHHQNELILNSAGEGIYGLNRQGKTTFINPAAARLTGWDAEDLIGRHQHDVLHHTKPDGTPYPSQECPIYAALNDGGIHRVTDEVFWRKDGTSFPVQYVSTPIRERGEIVGAVVLFEDVTERKEAEEALKESEERFRTAFEDAPIGVALVRLDGRRLKVNLALCEMLGYSEEELLGKDYSEVIHPEDREVSADHLRQILEGELETYVLERRYVRADEHTVWNLTSVSLVRDSRGEPSHLVCLHQDVTERKEAEEKLRKSEERFRSLARNATDLITVLEEDGTICYESPTIERILGYLPEERIGKNAFDYLHPEDKDRSKATFAEALTNPGQVQRPVEFRIRRKDGTWRPMETTRTNLLNDPAVKGVVANSRDITERRRAEEALRESEERYRAVVEQSPEAIWLFGPTSKQVLETNTTFQGMFGYSDEELKEMTNYDFVTHSREDIDAGVRRIVQEGRGFFGERKYRRRDGTVLDVEVSGSVIPYQGEEVVCGVARDLTERKELEEQLRHQAFHDSLTELPNRTLFLDRLGHALARARREDGPVAVLLMDLNDFKDVNDSLGHDAGNAVLIEVAERLRESVRPGDTVGRIFGDEFAVLLEAPTSIEEAGRVAERLQKGLQAPFDVDGEEVFVSPSIGIALGESPDDRPEEVLRQADLAMYEAKRRGKAEYQIYKPSMNTRAVNRMDLESELRRAVEREEFEVHYQPVIELETGSVAGFEALARWSHPERGLIDAEEFIELAEETGLIRPIGQRVLEAACRQAKEWRERYPDGAPWMSVNFSASQFSRQPDLIPKVLSEIGLEPNGL